MESLIVRDYMRYAHKQLYNYINFYTGDESVLDLDPFGVGLGKAFKKGATLKTKKRRDFKKIEPYAFILINSTVHYVRDLQTYFDSIHSNMRSEQRVIGTYYSNLWRPLISIATKLGLRSNKLPVENWITHEEIRNILYLSDFEIISKKGRVLIPIYLPFMSNFVNKYLSDLPILRHFCLINVFVTRPINKSQTTMKPSVSVIVPVRNEKGNLEVLVKTMPKMGHDDEWIFIEGGSTDESWDELVRLEKKYSKKNIVIMKQSELGKNNAVQEGFEKAKKQIFMILDSDLSVDPADLTKFYKVIEENKGELVIGNRLMYPMEKKAMQFLNMVSNKLFGKVFSYTLGQNISDTLCGTKVISKKNYKRLVANKHYFGDFDPFGDFDLIFGAVKLGIKITEVPIQYKARSYGSTNIHRWKHGFMLIKMIGYAFIKIKFI